MGRKIVLFADGTGNAFTMQESNVWRLYQALDQSRPDQLARYIPGVGTSGFRPFAILDGATGIGVPSNVRKLYRFLCWNWRPDDEIYLFGFSRGAFTIRTLVGLISSQGLVPAKIAGEFVGRAEMDRNAMAAWRAYRAGTAKGISVSPLIWVTRKIRNALLWIYSRIRRHVAYDIVRAETKRQGRDPQGGLKIKFLGLFDTVEAYGVPIEELRRAIDWVIWPISFRNKELSGMVERANHALALDDERTSFHPLRFDMTNERDNRITEVWFAGVHSDIGGGYPESALAHVPLVWMAEAAELRTVDVEGQSKVTGLRFSPGELAQFKSSASPLEPTHDSRSGLAVFYRYDPRPIGTDKSSGGAPVIHHSVAEKMVFGSEGYAPITLPSTAYVLLPDGTKHLIDGFGVREGVAPPEANANEKVGDEESAASAVAKLSDPIEAFVDMAQDTVWWRRVAYAALLLAVALSVSLPLTAVWLTTAFDRAGRGLAGLVGLEGAWKTVWDFFASANDGVGSNLNSVAKVVGGFLPNYAESWIGIFIQRPLTCGVIVTMTYLLYRTNDQLRDRIADRARCAWFYARPDPGVIPAAAEPGLLLMLARFLRKSPRARAAYAFVTRKLLPGTFIVMILVVMLTTLSRTTVSYREGQGVLCHATTTELAEVPRDGSPVGQTEFDIKSLCSATGIRLEKGLTYRVEIDARDEPFFDQTIMADVNGFRLSSWTHVVALPIRRWWSAAWFQPVAKIGAGGLAEWPLIAADGSKPLELDADGSPIRYWEACRGGEMTVPGCPLPEPELHASDPIPAADLPHARKIHQAQDRLRRVMVSEFVAPESGELFLYVNEAILGVPFLETWNGGYYRNNSGRAVVTVSRVVPMKL
jgi:Uncharacterized alpha/beta hydrolase domain (DUF2235)